LTLVETTLSIHAVSYYGDGTDPNDAKGEAYSLTLTDVSTGIVMLQEVRTVQPVITVSGCQTCWRAEMTL
jgi:hypothetical protein